MDSNISRVAEIVIEVFAKAVGVGHGYDWIRLARTDYFRKYVINTVIIKYLIIH